MCMRTRKSGRTIDLSRGKARERDVQLVKALRSVAPRSSLFMGGAGKFQPALRGK